MQMRKEEDIKGYTSRLMEVVNQMKIYGDEISDAKVVQKILGTLDKRFNTMSTIIVKSKDITNWSVTEFMGSLLAHEHKYSKDDSRLENAFASKHQQKSSNKGNNQRSQGAPRFYKKEKSKGEFPSCGICNKTNHLEKEGYHKGKSKCNRCTKDGHLEKDCWHKQKQQPSSATAHLSYETEDSLFDARQATSTYGSKERWFNTRFKSIATLALAALGLLILVVGTISSNTSFKRQGCTNNKARAAFQSVRDNL